MAQDEAICPEPREDDIPVIRTKPSPGHRIKRTHLWGMRRTRLPRRAVEATEAVEKFLIEQGHFLLVAGHIGVSLPEPLYGGTPAS